MSQSSTRIPNGRSRAKSLPMCARFCAASKLKRHFSFALSSEGVESSVCGPGLITPPQRVRAATLISFCESPKMLKSIAFFFMLLATTPVEAATRSYTTPMLDGHRLGACLSDGASCGKIAADAFCKKEGFAESILFARETVPSSRLVDTGQLCESGQCEAFKRIKCFQPQEQAAN